MVLPPLEETISQFFSIPRQQAAEIVGKDTNHYVFEIQQTVGFCRLYVVTLAQNKIPSRIYSRPIAGPTVYWKTTSAYSDGNLSIYYIELYIGSVPPYSRFYIRDKNSWQRTLNPYSSTMELPPNWGFSKHHLFLTYDFPDSIEPEEKKYQRAFIREVVAEGNSLVVRGALITGYEVQETVLTVRKFRDEKENWTFPIELVPAERVWGLPAGAYGKYRNEHAYKFECAINLDWGNITSSIYSLILHIGDQSTGLHRFNQTFLKKDNLFFFDNSTIFAFIDVASDSVRFERYSFGADGLRELDHYKTNSNNRPVCLIGEYTNSARDNGFHLFQYMRNRTAIDSYYVIENECGLSGEKVLEFGTLEHVKHCIDARVIAFTHHPSYVAPYLPNRFRKKQAKTFFLQHVVTALKNSMGPYNASKRRFSAFNVCSENEAEIVRRACGYKMNEITICGFPRFDNLLDLAEKSETVPNNILIFPTWRRGLDKTTIEEFERSEFFTQWLSAVILLRKRMAPHSAQILLVSHPIIGRHASAFREHVDAIVDVEEIQSLLADAACLITDYSSIVFDAIYVGKPVLFFTFDEAEYKFGEEAFININTQLPGPRVLNPEDLADAVEELWDTRGHLGPNALELRPLYFSHVDKDNCARAEAKIQELCASKSSKVATRSDVLTITRKLSISQFMGRLRIAKEWLSGVPSVSKAKSDIPQLKRLLTKNPDDIRIKKKIEEAAFVIGRASINDRKYEDARAILSSVRDMHAQTERSDRNLEVASLRGARAAEAAGDRKTALRFWRSLKEVRPGSEVASKGITRCSN